MSQYREPICFTCGGTVSREAESLNRLESGQVCPTCRERLLDLMPPLVPGFGHDRTAAAEVEEDESWEVSRGPEIVYPEFDDDGPSVA